MATPLFTVKYQAMQICNHETYFDKLGNQRLAYKLVEACMDLENQDPILNTKGWA